MRRTIAVAALLIASCATKPAQTPAQSLAALESRLAEARATDLQFDITARGALDVHATGSLRSKGPDLVVDVTGESGGVKTTASFDASSPELRRDVMAGGIRMGFLHNLVRLLGQMNIDRADRAQVLNVAFDPAERKYSFDIAVDGKPIAAAGLWIGANGLPAKRQQTINFPGGQVFVEERYTWR